MHSAPDRFDFGDIFQASPVAAVVVQATEPDFPVVALNEAFRRLLSSGASTSAGRPPQSLGDELIGKSLLELVPLVDSLPAEIRQSLADTVASGEPRSLVQQGASLSLRPIFGDNGKVSHVVNYVQPHTDRPTEASPLEESLQGLTRAFQFSATGLVVFDLTGTVVDCNPSFASALGYSREQLRGLDAASIVHPADREQRQQSMWRLFTGEAPSFVLESRYLRRDGTEAWVCDSVSLLRDADGQPQRVIAISEDISKRKRAEQIITQNEVLVTMGRLSASIAHELNNPLESVTNLLYLISNSTEFEDAKYYSTLAEQELARVTKIATQTLRFYRPQSAPAPVQLNDVIESVLALFEGRIRRDRVNVVKQFHPATPALLAYSSELRQVFLNLVGNSLDAMSDQGSLSISVRGSRDWTGTHRQGVRVTVCDAGSGIPKAMLQKVFEPFVSTKEQSGTGLGLWISRDIVRRHGGVLHVRSSETGTRRGTCMSVFLPIATEQADANAA